MKHNEVYTKFQAYLLTEKRVSHNTFAAYKQDIDQLIIFCDKNNKNLATLTSNDLKSFLHYLHDQKLSARSVSRKISSLKALFSYLHERYEFANITETLHFPKLEKKLPQYLSEVEIKALFDIVERDASNIGKRNKIMLYLLYVTGMRVSELIQLKISDLHFDTGFIMVNGKGGKQRMIPVPQSVLAMVNTYIRTVQPALVPKKGTSQTEYLFPIVYAGKIKPISRQAFWGILKEIWKRTGNTRRISPHQLRHSLATHMLKNGADLRSLQLILGHENLSTVQIYTHVETSYIRTIYDKKHPRS